MNQNEDNYRDGADDIDAGTAAASPELADHDRVGELEKALEEANSKALYAAAEQQNTRRRLEKEMADARTYASAGFARDMLAIKDNMERALAAVSDELRADQTAANFLAGIEATARELDSVFARNGVERVASKGLPLDPHRHQAMIEIPSDEEPGTIIEEMQPGYVMKDRLLRPALVGVAKSPN